jgi:hypothetical protein
MVLKAHALWVRTSYNSHTVYFEVDSSRPYLCFFRRSVQKTKDYDVTSELESAVLLQNVFTSHVSHSTRVPSYSVHRKNFSIPLSFIRLKCRNQQEMLQISTQKEDVFGRLTNYPLQTAFNVLQMLLYYGYVCICLSLKNVPWKTWVSELADVIRTLLRNKVDEL